MKTIVELAKETEPYVIGQRHWLHQHPELSWQEEHTTEHIAAELTAMGLEPQRFPGKTGLTAMIHGGKAGPDAKTILLRADIDALPFEEANDVPYKSVNHGVMHACGHDCHSAMLLGAAKILTQLQSELTGNVKLLFQGGEETAVGAKYYVDQGVTKDVQAVYGCHVNTDYPAGDINLQVGPRLPSCDEFTIVVHGEATHGAMPHRGKDAIVAAANIVMSLQTLVSRVNDPQNPLVLSIGRIEGGQRYNMITNRVEMVGTIRTFSREMRSKMDEYMRNIIDGAAQAMGCTAELQYKWGTGPVIHDSPMMNKVVQDAAAKVYDPQNINEKRFGVFSDDFAFFSEQVPGFYAMIGARNEELNCVYPNHHECFNVDESILKNGSAMFAQVVAEFFGQKDL